MGKVKYLLVIISISYIQNSMYATAQNRSLPVSTFSERAKKFGNNVMDGLKSGFNKIADTAKAGYYRVVEKSKYADKKGIDHYNTDTKTAVFKKISEIKNDQRYELNKKADQIFDKKVTGSGIVKLKKLEKEVDKRLIEQQKQEAYIDWRKENQTIDDVFKSSAEVTKPISGIKESFQDMHERFRPENVRNGTNLVGLEENNSAGNSKTEQPRMLDLQEKNGKDAKVTSNDSVVRSTILQTYPANVKVNAQDSNVKALVDSLKQSNLSTQQRVVYPSINKLSPDRLAPFNRGSSLAPSVVQPATPVGNSVPNISSRINGRLRFPIQSPGFGGVVGDTVRSLVNH